MTDKNLKNPPLGTIACSEPGCSQSCTVHQNKRGKGRFFYTRGPVECGCCEQSHAALRQSRIWHEADFYNRDELEPPPNLIEKIIPSEQGKEPEKKQTEPGPESGGPSMTGIVAGLAFIGLTIWGFIKL